MCYPGVDTFARTLTFAVAMLQSVCDPCLDCARNSRAVSPRPFGRKSARQRRSYVESFHARATPTVDLSPRLSGARASLLGDESCRRQERATESWFPKLAPQAIAQGLHFTHNWEVRPLERFQ
jgi:hypothetical protein